MAGNDLVVRLMGDAGDFERSLKSAQQSASVFERELANADQRQIAAVAHVTRMRSQYEQQAARESASAAREAADAAEQAAEAEAEAFQDAGKAAVAGGAAIAAGLALSVRAAVDWESAWAGVAKTVDGNAAEMGVLEGQLRDLTSVLPATHEEIAAVAEAAGQLGVQRGAIAGFTKTMIDLGATTNLSAEEAATAIAQMANIMGTSAADVERLASTLVALGNDGASTEADILAMSLRLAGAGALVDATEGEVLALANALSSMGIEAELGGGATSRTLTKIYAAVKDGGTQLQGFAEVAGMSAEQFAVAFEDSPIRALNSFVQGLDEIDIAGGNVVAALDELSISGTQDLQVLLRLKGAGDLLTESLDLQLVAWEANTALVKEADARYATTEAQMQIAKNAVNELAIDLGTTLLPALAAVIGGVTDFARWLAELPAPIQATATVIAALSAGILLASGAAALAAPRIAALKVTLDLLFTAAVRTALGMGVLTTTMKAGLLGAAAAVGFALGKLAEHLLQNDAPAVDAFTTSLQDFVNNGQVTGEAADRLGAQFENLGRVMDVANSNKANIIDGNGAMQINEYRDLLKGLDETLAGMVTSGNGEAAAQLYAQMSNEAVRQGRSVEELNGWLVKYGEAQRGASTKAEAATDKQYDLAEALVGTTIVLGQITPGLGAFAKQQGLSEEATKALIEQVKAWGTVLAAFVNPLGAYTDLLAEATEAERANAEKGAQAQNEAVDKKILAIRRDYDARIEAARNAKALTADELRADATTADSARDAAGKKIAATADEKNARRDAQTDLRLGSAEAIRALEDERDATIDTHEKGKKSWEDYANAVSVSVEQYLLELEEQVKAQQDWQTNMLIISSKVSPAVVQMFRDMGADGAPVLAQFVNATDAELARLEPIAISRTEAYVNAMGQTQEMAGPVLAALSGQLGEKMIAELSRQLGAGQTTVQAIMDRYGVTIEQGIVVPLDRAAARLTGFDGQLAALNGRKVIIGVDYRTSGGELVPDRRQLEFASGGLVRGPGTGTSDDIPIWASDQEFVMQQKAVAFYGVDFMRQINEARLPRPPGYAAGGLVGSTSQVVASVPVSAMPAASGPVDNRQTTTHDRRVNVEAIYASDWKDVELQLERAERRAALHGG